MRSAGSSDVEVVRPHSSTPTPSRPGARSGLVVALLGLLLLVVAAPAAGSDEVVGTLVQYQVDPATPGSASDGDRSAVRIGAEVVAVGAVEGSTGDRVRVRLNGDGTGTVLATLPVLAGSAVAGSTLAAASVLGAHTLTILPVWWSGHGPDTKTTADLSTLASSVGTYWSQQSAGAISTTTSARGWTQVVDPGSCSNQGLYDLMDQALAAAGIPVDRPVNQHVVVYFAPWAGCGGWAGLASVGGSEIWVNGEPYEDVVAHELGHNLGLGHAFTLSCLPAGVPVALAMDLGTCGAQEYADRADLMGFSMRTTAGSLNTALASVLGLTRSVPATPGTTTLYPLSAPDQIRAITVPTAVGTVYLDYRPAAGRDLRAPTWAGVQAHLLLRDDGVYESYLLDMSPSSVFDTPNLAVGSSWTVPGTSTVISVTSAGATAQVNVSGAVWTAVERFWSPVFGNAHFYTANEGEAQHLSEVDRNWVDEGRAFRAAQPADGVCQSGTQAVYRFYSSVFASHFYTQSAAERDQLVATDRNWTYEGLAYCAYSSATADSVALYRFWSAVFGKHFYTASQAEADHLRAADPNWSYEGIAYYVLP